MSSVSLKTLLVPSKEVEVEYPGQFGFKLKLAFLSRETMVSIRKKATKHVYKNRQATEELDDDLFLKLYVQAAVKGWEGLKYSILEQLAPVDLSGQNPDDVLEYSEDNALMLMKSSTNFDAFISDTVTDLGNFQKSKDSK